MTAYPYVENKLNVFREYKGTYYTTIYLRLSIHYKIHIRILKFEKYKGIK